MVRCGFDGGDQHCPQPVAFEFMYGGDGHAAGRDDLILQDRAKESPKVEIITEYYPSRIVGENLVTGIDIVPIKTGEQRHIKVDGVFVEIGLMPNSSLFVDSMTTNTKGEILVDTECRTGVAGVFACGDVTSVPYKQVVVAAGEGAKAALSAYQYLIVQR